jgi:exosortase/archaeosortase family protein
VALFRGELLRYAFFRRIFFLLSGVALAFGCNVVRTTYLVRVCDLKGKSALNLAHDPAGFTILGITLAGLLGLAWFFRPRKARSGSQGIPPADEKESAVDLEVRTRWSELGDKRNNTAHAPTDVSAKKPAGQRSGMTLAIALVGSVLWIIAVEAGIEAWFRPTENRAGPKSTWSLQLPTEQAGYRETSLRDSLRTLLRYDEGRQAEWREANGRPWQAYYLRWYAAHTRYRAVEAAAQARGHAPDVCLQLAGMKLQKNSGHQLQQVNGVTVLVNVERFSDQGRTLHVLTCYWEPDPAALEYEPSSPPSTANALRSALHALQVHDRCRNEKCVLKVGVWGMETDDEAETAFRQFLERAIRPSKPASSAARYMSYTRYKVT